MKILALDSCATTASVAVTEDEQLLGQYTVHNMLTHSDTLLPMTESLLKSVGWRIADVELFVCAAGPGSFTGVRIGCATLKGLAFGSGRPCVGVSTLESLACGVEEAAKGSVVCPIMDARRQQVYNALFRDGARLTEDRAIAIDALADELRGYQEEICFVGAVQLVEGSALSAFPRRVLPAAWAGHNAYGAAKCGFRKFTAAPGAYPDEALLPIYLRPSQAERTRSQEN